MLLNKGINNNFIRNLIQMLDVGVYHFVGSQKVDRKYFVDSSYGVLPMVIKA